jgi:hypothetical protein
VAVVAQRKATTENGHAQAVNKLLTAITFVTSTTRPIATIKQTRSRLMVALQPMHFVPHFWGPVDLDELKPDLNVNGVH